MVEQQKPDRRQWPGLSYVLLLGDHDDQGQSPIQHFSHAMLAKTGIVQAVLRFPATVEDFAATREWSVFARVQGCAPYRIFPLNASHVDAIAQEVVRFPFTCVISDHATVESVERLIPSLPSPVLHVTTATHPTVLHFPQLTVARLLAHCGDVIQFFRARGAEVKIPALPAQPAVWPPTSRSMASHHSVTLPNELALSALRIAIDPSKTAILPEQQFTGSLEDANRPYVDAIADSAAVVKTYREETLTGRSRIPAIDLILASSACLHSSQRPTLIDDASAVVEALAAQERYPTLLLPTARLRKLVAPAAAQEVLRLRRSELELFTTVLGALSAANVAPTLLLPPTVNRANGRLRDVIACMRSKSTSQAQKWSKYSRIARSVSQDLRRALDPKLQRFVDDSLGGIKLVSDAPLELLPVDGLPLCLQRECSRITATPGNLLVKHALRAEIIPLTAASLRKVLLLRSYPPDDPIRQDLENGIDEWLSHAQHPIDVERRDVQTVAEAVAALNSFDGDIVVFDMHGRHTTASEYGSLVVGNEELNAWTLRGRVRIPAIVILSACETHAVGTSHATVANGLLDAGAHTVLATLTPVLAHHSAYFVGRLLFHVSDRIPDIGRQSGAFRWSQLTLDLRRRMYLFDVIRQLLAAQHLRITQQEADRVLNGAMGFVGRSDWFTQFLAAAADAAGHSLDELRELHRQHAYFTDTLQYVELGSPERLLILGATAASA